MREDFLPQNIDLWISNYKREEGLNHTIRGWLNSYDFETVNVVANHSSISQNSIDNDLRDHVIVHNNWLRSDLSIGPQGTLYNELMILTFTSGKNYCLMSHDDMDISPGWPEIVVNTSRDLYICPQGTQVFLITQQGLRDFGFFDQRFSVNGHYELDYISRALHKAHVKGIGKASLSDLHWWEYDPVYNPTGERHLRYNSVGLEHFWKRISHDKAPQCPDHQPIYDNLEWQKIKWPWDKDWGYPTTSREGVYNGSAQPEIDWYPWLDLNTMKRKTFV